MDGLEALKKIENSYRDQKKKLINDPFIHLHERMWFLTIERELKAFEIIKKSISDATSLDLLLRELLLQGKINQDEYNLLKETMK